MLLETKSAAIAAKSEFNAKFVLLHYGRAEVDWTYATHEGVLSYLKKSYQVETVVAYGASEIPTSPEQPDKSDDVQAELQPDKQGSSEEDTAFISKHDDTASRDAGPDPDGDGEADFRSQADTRKEKIRATLKTLDVNDPDHFTDFGKPLVSAVANHVPDVTRKEIVAAWPEFNRDLASKLD